MALILPRALGRTGRAALLAAGAALIVAATIRVATPQPRATYPPAIPAPEGNPPTSAKIRLGRRLFFEPALSADGTVSCATCHDPRTAFTANVAFAKGIGGAPGTRNPMSLLDAAYSPLLMWNGAAVSLEDQVRYPLRNPVEMASSEKAAVRAIGSIPSYRPAFQAAFGDGEITYERITQALASFERTLISNASAFDDFYFNGRRDAISESARRGWELFNGRARCWSCHTFDEKSPFFTDFEFHSLGLGFDRPNPDMGLWIVTRVRPDEGRFRTPSLRNVAVTAPYMHDGRFATLREIVDYHAAGGTPARFRDVRLRRPLVLSERDRTDLVHFLESLTERSHVRDSRAWEKSIQSAAKSRFFY